MQRLVPRHVDAHEARPRAPERDLIRRYVGMIQIQRGDYNGRVITVRAEDVRALARVFERDEAGMRRRLDELGIRL